MRVVLTNTAALNAGDAAILFATIGILRRALGDDLHVTACDQQPEETARTYPDLDVHPTVFAVVDEWAGAQGMLKVAFARVLLAAFLWRTPLGPVCARLLPPSVRHALTRIAAADLVISAGGTYLVPHYRILPKLTDLLVAYAMGRRYVLFTQSLGPFPGGKERRLIRFVLRRACLILVRDSRSRHHLEALGVRGERIIECADAAFALSPDTAEEVATARPVTNAGSLRVAISVRDWPHIRAKHGMKAYFDAISALTENLVSRHGAEVTFLSTCQGVGAYWTDDSATAETIVMSLDETVRDAVSVDREFHTPYQLVSTLGRFDAVVATRMHVAILALLAGVPVLPIAYEFKTAELFAKLGLDGLVQDIETITPGGLRTACDHFLSVRADLAAMLPGLVAREQRAAFAAGEYVREALAAAS